MTEQTAKRIEKLLLRLLTILDPTPTPKIESAASVATVTTVRGQVNTDDASEDVPQQLTHDERAALRFSQGAYGRRMRRADTQPVEGRSGRIR